MHMLPGGSEQGSWVLLLHWKEPYCYFGGRMLGQLAQMMGRRGLGRVRLVSKNVSQVVPDPEDFLQCF